MQARSELHRGAGRICSLPTAAPSAFSSRRLAEAKAREASAAASIVEAEARKEHAVAQQAEPASPGSDTQLLVMIGDDVEVDVDAAQRLIE